MNRPQPEKMTMVTLVQPCRAHGAHKVFLGSTDHTASLYADLIIRHFERHGKIISKHVTHFAMPTLDEIFDEGGDGDGMPF